MRKADTQMMWGYNGPNGGGMFGWGYMGMWFSLVLGIVLVGVIVWAVLHFTTAQTHAIKPNTPVGSDALELLRQRYARGEIDESTFTRMRQQLTAPPDRS